MNFATRLILYFFFVTEILIYFVGATDTGFAYPVQNINNKDSFNYHHICTTTDTGSRVDVRNPGQNIRLEDCQDVQSVQCQAIPDYHLQCYKGDCQVMNGLMECINSTKSFNEYSIIDYGAQCRNLTSVLNCEPISYEYQPDINCNKIKNCLKLSGVYLCDMGVCKKVVKHHAKCKQICDSDDELHIGDADKSVIIRKPNGMTMAKCARALRIDEDNGNFTEIWPLNFRNEDKIPNLLIICSIVGLKNNLTNSWDLSDCYNGTLLAPDYYGKRFVKVHELIHTQMEFTEVGVLLRGLERDSGLIGLTEIDLKIASNVKFYFNQERCTGSTDECISWGSKYGQGYAHAHSLSLTDDSDNLFRFSFRCHYTNCSSKTSRNYFILISFILMLLIRF